MSLIHVENLHKTFKTTTALDGVSFDVDKGHIFGFLGPSGAGKTTTINIITGQMKPDSGTATLLDVPSRELKPNDYKQIGIVSDSVGFYERMTVWEDLIIFARLHKVDKSHVEDLLKKVDLWEARNTKGNKLSVGVKQRMLLVRAILHQPKVLFLDEPTSGLDPSISQTIHKLLKEVRDDGCAIFLITHDMEEARDLCDQLSLLYKGKIVESGSPQEIIDRYSEPDTLVLELTNGKVVEISRDALSNYDMTTIKKMHSKEKTLEQIFITLTGGSLMTNRWKALLANRLTYGKRTATIVFMSFFAPFMMVVLFKDFKMPGKDLLSMGVGFVYSFTAGMSLLTIFGEEKGKKQLKSLWLSGVTIGEYLGSTLFFRFW